MSVGGGGAGKIRQSFMDVSSENSFFYNFPLFFHRARGIKFTALFSRIQYLVLRTLRTYGEKPLGDGDHQFPTRDDERKRELMLLFFPAPAGNESGGIRCVCVCPLFFWRAAWGWVWSPM